MKIVLQNIEINNLVPAVGNARRNTDPMPGRINMRLDEAIAAIRDQYQAFSNNLEQLQKDHIAATEDETLKTERNEFGQQVYVFKSDADEQEYLAVTEETHVIDIRGLTAPDLEQLLTSRDQFGSSTQHFRHLKLITQGHANVPEQQPKQTNKPKTTEEE